VSPLGTIEATGRRFSVSGIEIFEVRADRVTRVSLVWDMVQLLSQLGVRSTSA
jgi:predicted ester cyclase